jgi:hypothetical protein
MARTSKTSTKVAKRRLPAPMRSAPTTVRGDSASQLIDARIKQLDDWRGEMLGRVRSLIKEADPKVVEEVKWRKPSNSMLGVPVWSHAGIICTGVRPTALTAFAGEPSMIFELTARYTMIFLCASGMR